MTSDVITLHCLQEQCVGSRNKRKLFCHQQADKTSALLSKASAIFAMTDNNTNTCESAPPPEKRKRFDDVIERPSSDGDPLVKTIQEYDQGLDFSMPNGVRARCSRPSATIIPTKFAAANNSSSSSLSLPKRRLLVRPRVEVLPPSTLLSPSPLSELIAARSLMTQQQQQEQAFLFNHLCVSGLLVPQLFGGLFVSPQRVGLLPAAAPNPFVHFPSSSLSPHQRSAASPIDSSSNSAILHHHRSSSSQKDNGVSGSEGTGQDYTINPVTGNRVQRNYKNITPERRVEANAHERNRVQRTNAAFEKLRAIVPSFVPDQTLSKLSILRIASKYILLLASMNGHDYSADQRNYSLADCMDLLTETVNQETKSSSGSVPDRNKKLD